MKILLSAIFLILFSSNTVDLDLGAPTIQAVCKVTLEDGEIVEGFITFGNGGFDYKYRPHGFCLAHDNGTKQLFLYDFKFNLSNLDNYASHRNGTSKLYYVKNISDRYSQQPISEFDKDKKILSKTYVDTEKLQLLDQMTMYKNLPLSLNLGYGESNEEKTTIHVNKIKSVELLKKPDKKWLGIIKATRERQRLSDEDDEWVDYQEPVWFHEVMNDKKEMTFLSQFF